MNNISYIYQPHFMTNAFRVSCKEQQSDSVNYIVVTSSPTYNGVWKWEAKDKETLDIWMNGRLPCYCVPINICHKVKDLSELTNPSIIQVVEEMQRKWKEKEVKKK